MADENIGDTNPPKQQSGPNNNNKAPMGMYIAGVNLGALAIYTFVFRFIDGGIIGDAFFLFIHVSFCIIMALAKKSWLWFLAAVLVLAIGFSTCVYLLPLNLNH